MFTHSFNLNTNKIYLYLMKKLTCISIFKNVYCLIKSNISSDLMIFFKLKKIFMKYYNKNQLQNTNTFLHLYYKVAMWP